MAVIILLVLLLVYVANTAINYYSIKEISTVSHSIIVNGYAYAMWHREIDFIKKNNITNVSLCRRKGWKCLRFSYRNDVKEIRTAVYSDESGNKIQLCVTILGEVFGKVPNKIYYK